MIRKSQLLFLLVLITITLIKADPYKPKPILFIHGVGSNSRAWDAPTFPLKNLYINGHLRKNFFTDSLLKDSIIADSVQLSNLLQDTVSATGEYLNGLLNLKTYGTGTYAHFWRKMEPIVNEWWRYQKNNSFPITFTVDSSSSWPNKTFLEVISFDDPWGSVDPHGGWPDRYNTPGNFTGTGDELICYHLRDDNFRRANKRLRENKKCEEFSQSVKILHTFGNRKILSGGILRLAILA